jgi:hypothetical protein
LAVTAPDESNVKGSVGIEPLVAGKQKPHWLREDNEKIQVLSQEEFFGPEERKCLPTFDSLTMENQLYSHLQKVISRHLNATNTHKYRLYLLRNNSTIFYLNLKIGIANKTL